MKKWILIGLIFLIIPLSLALLFSFDASNQNTFINSVEYIPDSPPGYGSNLTIRANITDFESDYIPWVNFTLISPSDYWYINNSNGTQFGDYWNSSRFQINETGTWTFNVTSEDNITINTTKPYTNGSFTITDDGLRWAPNKITATTNLSTDKLYNITLWTDSVANLNFTITEDSDGNFTVTLNASLLISSAETTLSLNISPNSSDYGNHSFNITVTRQSPLDRAWNISVNVEITSNFGDIEFVGPGEYFIANLCPGAFEHSTPVINYGNYDNMSCHPYLYNSSGDEISTTTGFTIDGGATGVARVSYSFTEDIITHFGVYCVASDNGSLDYTSNDPKVTLIEGADCGDSGGGGAGAAVPRIVEVVKEPPLPEPPRVCGDGVCDDDLGESPWSCSRDCLTPAFDVKKIFCLPFLDCGNWKTAWFINSIVILIGIFFLYFMIVRKPGRLR